jgi:hypothetical protein
MLVGSKQAVKPIRAIGGFPWFLIPLSPLYLPIPFSFFGYLRLFALICG